MMNDHREIGLEVFGDALLAAVERHVEQPAANIELHESVSGNVGSVSHSFGISV